MTPVTHSLIFGIILSFLSCCLIYWATEHNYKLTLLMAACAAFLTFCMVQDIKKIYKEDVTKQAKKIKICNVCNSQHGCRE